MYTGWLLLFEALFVFIAGDPRAPAEEPPLAPPTATLRPASEPITPTPIGAGPALDSEELPVLLRVLLAIELREGGDNEEAADAAADEDAAEEDVDKAERDEEADCLLLLVLLLLLLLMVLLLLALLVSRIWMAECCCCCCCCC